MGEYDRRLQKQESKAITNNTAQNKLKKINSKDALSPLQKMVAVPGLSNPKAEKDAILVSHIDWAMRTSGGKLVDFTPLVLKELENTEPLHLVAHGKMGRIADMTAMTVIVVLNAGLKADYRGPIRISSCCSGERSIDPVTRTEKIDSLVDLVKQGIKNPCIVTGYRGPTVTNDFAKNLSGDRKGIITLKPVYAKPISNTGDIDEINARLAPYTWKQEAISLFFDTEEHIKENSQLGVFHILQHVILNRLEMPIATGNIIPMEKISEIAVKYAPFYYAFVEECGKSGLIITESPVRDGEAPYAPGPSAAAPSKTGWFSSLKFW